MTIPSTIAPSSTTPSNFTKLYSRQQISEAVSRMGREISVWADQVWDSSHTDLLAVPVLRGGIFIFADLVRSITRSVEITSAQSWAYQVGENEVQRDNISVNLSQVPAKGRHVLVIDDICDSGRTLKTLSQSLTSMGAIEVRSAVLIKRAIDKEIIKPNWVGFEYPGHEWFVGYGMEDSERWRNLPEVYIIQKGGDK